MRKNSKITMLLSIMLVCTLLVGCQLGNKQVKKNEKEEKVIHIAALNGPTGMGMTQLIDINDPKYDIALYQSPDEIIAKLVNGELDIACIPSNLAAVLYQKTNKQIQLLGTNTLGVLYIVEKGNSIKTINNLKGKTIYVAGKGSTPEFILQMVLENNKLKKEDVKIEYVANHTDTVGMLQTKENAVVLLPEPHVTIAKSKISGLTVPIDMNREWKQIVHKPLPMGVIVARKPFIEENKEAVDQFIKNYEASVVFVNTHLDEAARMMEENKILPSQKIARMAIQPSNIVWRSVRFSKGSLEDFYKQLKEIEPKSIGGEIPDEGFYYSEE